LTIQNRRSGRSDDNRMNVSFNRLMWGQWEFRQDQECWHQV
jgi:hypothetical protein